MGGCGEAVNGGEHRQTGETGAGLRPARYLQRPADHRSLPRITPTSMLPSGLP